MSGDKQVFWSLCNDNEKKFLKELAMQFSAYWETEDIGEGVIVRDENPPQPYRCYWDETTD